MTTVVYHNGILAADTRGTRSIDDPKVACSECGATGGKMYNDNRDKIHCFPSPFKTFYGEAILAAGFAGRSDSIRTILSTMKNRDGAGVECVMDAIAQTGIGSDLGSLTVLLVTDRHIHTIDHNEHAPMKQTRKRFSLDTTVAIGSGAGAARAAIECFGLPIWEAVAVAMISDMGRTGGNIQKIDLAVWKKTPFDIDEIGLEFLKQGYRQMLGV